MSDRDGSRPNILIILADDLGYSDIGAYGGEIDTPNLDELAASGTIFSQFYNTARCSASRASLLTGLHPHETGIGILTQNDGPVGYPGTINKQCATLAEIVSAAGYKTHISGKWHLSEERAAPNDSWPTSRGFDTFFGTLTGCGSYFDPGTLTRNERPAQDATNPDFFYTDAIGDDSAEFVLKNKDNTPFFLYSAFTAPHWPLHALESDLALMRGRYDEGWDVLRDARFSRQKAIGLISDPNGELSARDPMVPPWDDVEDQAWQVKRMEAYAAMVHCLDRNVGKIMNAIEETGQKDNTIIIFLSDNGASYEELPSTGPEADFHRARRENFPGVTRKGNQIRLGNDPGIIPGAE